MILSWKDKKNISPSLKSAILYHQRSVLDCLNRCPDLFKKNLSCFKDIFVVNVPKLQLDDSEVQKFEKIVERRCINQVNKDVQHTAKLDLNNKIVKLINASNDHLSELQKFDKVEEKNLDKSTKESNKEIRTGLKSGLICLVNKSFKNDYKSKCSSSSLNKAAKCNSTSEKLKKDEKVDKTKLGSTVVKPKDEELNVNKVTENLSMNSKRNTLPSYLNDYKIAKKPKFVKPTLNQVEESVDKKMEEKKEAKRENVVPSNQPPRFDEDEDIDVLAIDDIQLDFDLYDTSFQETENEANNKMNSQETCEIENVAVSPPKKPNDDNVTENAGKEPEQDTKKDVDKKAVNNVSIVYKNSSKLYPTLELAEELLDYESDSSECEGNFKRLSKNKSTYISSQFGSYSQQDKSSQPITVEKTISEKIDKSVKQTDFIKDKGDNQLIIAKATQTIEVKSPILSGKLRVRESPKCSWDSKRSSEQKNKKVRFDEFKANLNQITCSGQIFEAFCNYSISNYPIMKDYISDVQSILTKITLSLIENDKFYFTKESTIKLIVQLKRFELDTNQFWSQIINTANTKFNYIPKFKVSYFVIKRCILLINFLLS